MSGVFGASHLFLSGESKFYDFEISNSLRLDRGSSENLERTPSSAGNRQIHTISMWVKRSEPSIGTGLPTRLFMATDNASNAEYQIIGFNASDQLSVLAATEGQTGLVNVKSNAVFRDVSAWYNIIVAQDTTQSTSSNRFKLYVNGTQITSFASTTYGSQNASYQINNNLVHYINRDGSSLGNNFQSVYIAEVNFIDGQALGPSSFGETKSGVWIPKNTSGLTFGTNGFRLKFDTQLSAFATTLDRFSDSSGIALYQFEDNTNDTSGNFNGVNTGVTFTETSPFGVGKAGVFDGNDFVTTSTSNYGVFNTTAYSIGVWVKWSGSYDNRIIFSSDETNNNFHHLAWQTAGGGISFRDKSAGMGGSDLSFAQTPVVGRWYHIGVTRNGSAFVLYLDGVRVATDTATTSTGSDGNFLIGSSLRSGSSSTRWVGEIDQLRVFNRMLTESEMAELGSGIGQDSSGNGNNFIITGLSRHDVVTDSPTNNYCIYNNADPHEGTLSQGNLKVVTPTSSSLQYGVVRGTHAMTSGKWYWEVYMQAISGSGANNQFSVGITSDQSDFQNFLGGDATDFAYFGFNGNKYSDSTNSSYGDTFTTGDIISVAYDADNGDLFFYKNGTIQNSGTAAYTGISGTFFPAKSDGNQAVTVTMVTNFGQEGTFLGQVVAGNYSDSNGHGNFKYPVPTGHLALNADNLPEPTISPKDDNIPEDYFETKIWTGNGSSQAITGLEFSPDWLWIKERVGGADHFIVDTLRGSNKRLKSDSTNGDITSSGLTSFDSNGFTVDSADATNQNGQNFVGWSWSAGGTPTATNIAGQGNIPTSGSVIIDGGSFSGNLAGTNPALKISANTKAGFSIVTYQGAGGDQTFAHGLNSAPEMVIVKCFSTNGTLWPIIHTGVAASKYLNLQSSISETDSDSMWDSTYPSSTVVSIGGSSHTSLSGRNYIAYCFHSVEGHSKIGSYQGNSDSNGTYVHTGFRPAYLLNKVSSGGTGHWHVYDNTRDPHNELDKYLYAGLDNDEGSSAEIDFLSNGFKWRGASSGSTHQHNVSGDTYVYIAFAEMPFKYANAR